MNIENIKKERLEGLPSKELYNLRFRCIQLYDRHFHNNSRTEAEGLERSVLLDRNKTVLDEMAIRKLKFKKESNLDRAIFKRDFLGLDVPGLGDVVIIEDCVTATGSFLRDPKETETIDIVIKKEEADQDDDFDQNIATLIKEATGKSPNIIYKPEGPKLSHIPIFDMILRAREETKRVDVKKEAEKKKMTDTKEVEEDLEKGALPFKNLGAAEESAAWNGPRETVKAEVDELRQMCAWYDSENPDVKASYKLPHHRYSDKKAVWRAVRAAMGALLGARGGVDIPAADKAGVHSHLSKHYKQWDKEAPELRKHDGAELEKMFSVEKLSAAQRKECDEETAQIKENRKLPIAGEPHEFKAAKFTHPNGHPRCLVCGDEEPIGKVCNMPRSWYGKYEWDDEKAWTEERKKLKASGKLKKSFPIKKPEETENMIRYPVGPDCEVTATIDIDPGQGITALYCGRIKKIRTYLFDKRKKAWTMDSARAWIKEHHEKTEKGLEAKLKKGELEANKDAGIPEEKCHWCKKAATKAYFWDKGRAYIPTCDEHKLKTKKEIETKKKSKVTTIKDIPQKKTAGTMFKIVKKDKVQQIVGGVIYEANEVDTQGDYADAAEIEKAMYGFMEKYATNTNRIKIDHKGKKYFFPILECFQAEEDTVKGGQRLTKGAWWLMIRVRNKSIWEQIDKGELTGFSMGGRAKA